MESKHNSFIQKKKLSYPNKISPKYDNAYDIEVFRLSNYTNCFGTIKHSLKFPEAIKQLIQENNGQILFDTSVHICDYHFILNERLFPEPVPIKEKGFCCCLQCCQPMYPIFDKHRYINSCDGVVKNSSNTMMNVPSASKSNANHGKIVYEILFGMHKNIDYNNRYRKTDDAITKKQKHLNSFALRFQ